MYKHVEIHVKGGVAEVVSHPEDVQVIIRNYDVLGFMDDDIHVDKDGDEYSLSST